MQAIKKILFPTDFSETALHAFRNCLQLAERWEARIDLLHVVFPEYDALDLPVMTTKATQEKVEAARSVLQSFVDFGLAQVQAANSLQHVPDIHADVQIGSPANVIAQTARRDETDLIVIGARGEHDLMEKWFGSVTTSVLEKAHCHVMIIPEHVQAAQFHTVVYASDLSEHDPYLIWKLGQWLEPFGAVLHCVHVHTRLETAAEFDFSELEIFFRDHAPALQIQFHTLEGNKVTKTLGDFAEEHGANLVVMFAPHHNLLERLFQVSHTREMAVTTQIPLLLIKN
jgi:nucleotide-binding universal stress UspA family protein